MIDRYDGLASSLSSPAAGAVAISPSDTVALGEVTRSLYIGGAGNVAVEMALGQSVVFASVPAGTVLPIRVRKVLAATTATAILGLF